MATNVIPALRRYDANSVNKTLARIVDALNFGGSAAVTNTRTPPRPFKSLAVTLLELPTPDDAGVGARALITDSNVSINDGLGLPAVNGGAFKVPVYSDGTDWIVG